MGWVTGYNFKKILYVVFFLWQLIFVLENSADPDEKPYSAALYLGLHCLVRYHFERFPVYKGLNDNDHRFR